VAAITPRERLLRALNHEEADRVPMDLGTTSFSGIHLHAYQRLKEYLGVSAEGERVLPQVQVAFPCEEILTLLGIDTRGVSLGPPDGFQDSRWADDAGDSYKDEWGIVRRRPRGGHYFVLHETPFGRFDLPGPSDVERYAWPDPEDPGRFRGLRERGQRLRATTDFALVGHLAADIFLRAAYLRGFEGFLTDLLLNESFVRALVERILHFWLRLATRFLDEVGDMIDVITLIDDIADQSGPFISPVLYRKFFKPAHAKLADLNRAKTKAKILFHCCGSVVEFLPDFVDLGIDALNPVQVSAKGMDMHKLKQEYGRHLSFWGGIDTHRVMPYGTPEEVRAEVGTRLEQMAVGGGYVLAAVHNIQPDVPPGNVVELYRAGAELGRYPIPGSVRRSGL